MKKSHISISFFLAAFLCAPSNANHKTSVSHYPTELIGTWEITSSSICNLPMDQDSQTAIFIREKELVEYEEWLEPIRIKQISKNPSAWKVDSIQHIYERKSRKTQIFVLDKRGRLTISDDHRTNIYSRCI